MAESSAPRCPHCGRELQRAGFTLPPTCPHCGRPIPAQAQGTQAADTSQQYSVEQRSAILNEHIGQLVRSGYRVTSRTQTTAQLVKPKEFSLLWALVWLLVTLCVFGLGIIIYLFYYLAQKDQTAYLEVDPYGDVNVTPESARRLIGGRPRAGAVGLSPTATSQRKHTNSLVVAVVVGVAVVGVTGSCCIMAALAPKSPDYSATTTAMTQIVRTPQPPATATPPPPPVDTAVPTPSYLTYTVQSGDTLSSIATRFGTTYQAIMELNGLTDTTIHSGTTLLIPTDAATESPLPAATGGPTPPPPATLPAPEPHVIGSLSEFESSQFCLEYACTLYSTWDLSRGGVNNSYDLGTRPDLSVEVPTLNDVPLDFGLTFYDRARLRENDFQLVNLFLSSIYPGIKIDPSVTAFIEQNVEVDVFQICQAASIPFGSLRIWTGKIMQQTVHVGADCP